MRGLKAKHQRRIETQNNAKQTQILAMGHADPATFLANALDPPAHSAV